jgi:hypothetical protein
MRFACLVFLLLTGCFSGRTAKDIDMSRVEPACARECLAHHTACVGQGSRTMGTYPYARHLDACTDGLESCRGTCPAK